MCSMPLSVNSVSPLNEHSPSAPSSFPVPPHLMGRNVENPANEPGYSGRRLQKPRFGVRVPYRNLTSQIVTQEEIAQEILERAMKKNVPSPSAAAIAECNRGSGESIFAMNLSRHLANRLSSPSKDLEVICHRNTADLRAKVQAEMNSCTVKLDVNLPGSPTGVKQPVKEVQIAGVGDATPATLHSSSLFSPRIKLHMTKLDKEVEREMALKQLKELPMIKGRSGEFAGDSPLSRSSRRVLNYSGKVSTPGSPDPKDNEKKDDRMVYHGDGCSSSCVPVSPVVHLHKLGSFQSPQKQDNVISNHVQVSAVSPCAQASSPDKMTQCKYAKTDKVFPKESKLRVNKTFHSKLSNRQRRLKQIRKRRSARLNISCARKEVNSLHNNSNVNLVKKKPVIKKEKSNVNISANCNGDVEGADKLPLDDVSLKHDCSDSNLPNGLQNGNTLDMLPEVEIERISALKCSTNPDMHSTKGTRECLTYVGETETVKNGSVVARKSQGESKKTSVVPRSRELDKLLKDEGALNMILETSPLVACVVKPRRKPTNRKLIKAMKQESITLKTNLAKKHVFQNLKSSKPKLRLTKDKASSSIEVIDLSHSPPKKTSNPKVAVKPPQNSLQNSSDVRRHSSIDSVPVVVSSKPPNNASKSVISCGENKAVNVTPVKSEVSLKTIPLVNLECIDVAQVKTPLNSNKQNVFRFSSVRRPVTIPRMSNSVRMKLNTEMSKNFLKGLNLDNSKYVPLKAKKNCLSPLKSTSSLDNVVLMNKDLTITVDSPSVSGRVSSDDVKRIKMVHEKELSVSLSKFNEKIVASAHDNQEDTICETSAIPEALPAPSIVSTNISAMGAKVVSKVKKDPNVITMKTLIDQEHRILTVPLSPVASSYSNITKGLKTVSPKYKKKSSKLGKQLESKECTRQRFSWRQNAGTFCYKEICLRRYENFVQIILAPCSTVMKNSLNVQVLHEFQDALQQLRRDRNCRVVLVTSTGSTFCQGIDLHSLIHVNVEHRKKAAEQLSKAIKDFMKTLAMFNKPIVAGVHGSSVGLGVTMLPFFDVVYASDKATFHTPYARLGQVPEGAAVLTLPLLLGNAVTSELLFGSRRLTATEAVHHGLVTRVLWPDKFQEELIPNVEAIANQSSQ
ncbi:hypothetical protein J437_LFUL006069, partial [Ladona fulva]